MTAETSVTEASSEGRRPAAASDGKSLPLTRHRLPSVQRLVQLDPHKARDEQVGISRALARTHWTRRNSTSAGGGRKKTVLLKRCDRANCGPSEAAAAGMPGTQDQHDVSRVAWDVEAD